MCDNYLSRPVAVYEINTDRLVAIFPTLEACKSVIPVGPGSLWGRYVWLYADEDIDEILGDNEDECPEPAQLHVGDEGIIACNHCGSIECALDCDPCPC